MFASCCRFLVIFSGFVGEKFSKVVCFVSAVTWLYFAVDLVRSFHFVSPLTLCKLSSHFLVEIRSVAGLVFRRFAGH